jgi:hypothetical protein
LTCPLCFIVLVLIVVLSLEYAIELRGKLLVDVTVCLTIFTIFITFIAVAPTGCPCITGLGMASGSLPL